MKNKSPQTASEIKTVNLKNLTPLSRKQLQIITGGDDPKIHRGTKTSAGI